MPETIKIDPGDPDPRSIEKVLAVLKAGGVIAYPTETFYGLGADAKNEKAVDRIFSVKGRDFKKPIPVIIGPGQDLASLVSEIPSVGAVPYEAILARSFDDSFPGCALDKFTLDGGNGQDRNTLIESSSCGRAGGSCARADHGHKRQSVRAG